MVGSGPPHGGSGTEASTPGQETLHSYWPAGSQLHTVEHSRLPTGTAVPQPLPGVHVPPFAHGDTGGGTGGGQIVLHCRWPVGSQEHELEHAPGLVDPPPQPEP